TPDVAAAHHHRPLELSRLAHHGRDAVGILNPAHAARHMSRRIRDLIRQNFEPEDALLIRAIPLLSLLSDQGSGERRDLNVGELCYLVDERALVIAAQSRGYQLP